MTFVHKRPPTFAKRNFASKKTKTADELVSIGITKAGDYWIGVHGAHQTLNGATYKLKVTVEEAPPRTP